MNVMIPHKSPHQLEEPGEPSSLELRLVEGLLGGGQVLVLVLHTKERRLS